MDRRLQFPATARNRDAILEVLRRVLPERGLVLEVASGSGEHAVWFATHLPGITWQPSDLDPDHLASIDAWRDHARLDNLRPAVRLDTTEPVWPVEAADALFCANMIHIAPWAAAEGLVAGAGRVLRPGGLLITYGPYKVGGQHTAPSNEAFDASLRSRDPAWGVRDLHDLTALAETHGLAHEETVAMPANNLVVVFRKGGPR